MTDDPKPAARQRVEIYTDGACEPNPGPGGYGAVLLHPKKRAETSSGSRFAYLRHPRLNDALPGLKSCYHSAHESDRSDVHYRSRVGHGLLAYDLEKAKAAKP